MARILVVEDEIDVYKLAELLLTRAGHEIEWAKNGVEALQKIAAAPPDLVLCDIMMPKMDGHQVLQAIRQDPRLNHLPVVMLTSRRESEDIEQARRMGAAGYIVKPFHAGELLKQVNRNLKPKGIHRIG